MPKQIKITVFGVTFKSISALCRAIGIQPQGYASLVAGHDSLEDYLRAKFYPRTDDMIADLLAKCNQVNLNRCASSDVAQVIELIKWGLKYQLDRPDLPRDSAYMLARKVFESPCFADALRDLTRARVPRDYGTRANQQAVIEHNVSELIKRISDAE